MFENHGNHSTKCYPNCCGKAHFYLINNTLILENVTAQDEGVFMETVVRRNNTNQFQNFTLIIQCKSRHIWVMHIHMQFIYFICVCSLTHFILRPTKRNRNSGFMELQHICDSQMWSERLISASDVEERKRPRSRETQILVQWEESISTHQQHNQLRLRDVQLYRFKCIWRIRTAQIY